jgi:hypothetical protein
MPKAERLADWQFQAVEIMARTGCSLTEAAGLLDKVITSDEIELILKRASFQKLLYDARLRFFNSLAQNPDWKKETAIGRLISLADKMEAIGQYDKAAAAVFQAAKAAGFIGSEVAVSVFGSLSQADLDAIRRKVEDASKQARPN